MRKLLSILMLVCLLLGMVLPAAADGEQPLYAQVGEDTEYKDSLTFEQEKTLTARFYTEQAEGGLITDGTFTSAPEGLTIVGPESDGKCTLSAAAAGTYTVSCVVDGATYQMGVVVTEPEPPSTTNTIPVPDAATLTEILADQTKFDTFLAENHYSGSGDLTLVLPAGALGSVTCGVQLAGGAKLILKGAATGSTMTSLTVNVPNVKVDDVDFTGSPALMVNTLDGLTVSNCVFKATTTTFTLLQDGDGNVSVLTLTGNTYSSKYVAKLVDADGKEIGQWIGYIKSQPATAEVDFGAVVSTTTDAIKVTVQGDHTALIDAGWTFEFKTNCAYSKAFVAYAGKRVTSSLTTSSKKIQFVTKQSGEYAIVNSEYPKLVKKSTYYTLTITQTHAKYLDEVTLDSFPYAAATITLNGKSVDYTMSTVSSKRSVTIPKLSVGTYTIKETTKTVTKTTKTTTTSRKYTTSTQGYHLVTPQGFSNAMRYVKDNLVTLDCSLAGRKPISLPVESMRAAAEKGYSVLVKTKNYELTLDAAALKSLAQQAKGTTVLLQYQSLNHKTLSTVGQNSVQSHLTQHSGHVADLAFLVTATSESETIEDLQQGSIQLKIPFIVLPGTEGLDNTVYALQGETVTEARDTTVAEGYLTTKLLDLTEHMVFQIGQTVETTAETTEPTVETTEETTEETLEPETEFEEFEEFEEYEEYEEEEPEGSGLLRGVIIVLCVLVAVIGAVVGIALLRKRKKK